MNVILAIIIGTVFPLSKETPTQKLNQSYISLDSTTGNVIINRTPLMHIFLDKFKANQSFNYLCLYGDDGYTLTEYQNTTITRNELEQNWKDIEYEKIVGLYVAIEDQLKFLLRDEGSLDVETLQAIDGFIESGKSYSLKNRRNIEKLVENHFDKDVNNFLFYVEEKVELGEEQVPNGEREAYRAILRRIIHRSAKGQIRNSFQTIDGKTYDLLCLFHNHNDGQPPSQGDYDASMNLPIGIARFYENNMVVYQFIVDGKDIGLLEPFTSPTLTKPHRYGLQYQLGGEVSIATEAYGYDEKTNEMWMSIRLVAQPELVAMLMFDEKDAYLGMIRGIPSENEKSIMHIDQLTTIPNGTMQIRIPSETHHLKTVSTNGEVRLFTPSFINK